MKKHSEWLHGDQKELEYHLKQYKEPKIYTVELGRLAQARRLFIRGRRYLDVACGCGSFIHYIKSSKPGIQYDGIDINPEYLDIAGKLNPDSHFGVGDIERPSTYRQFAGYDGASCLQTLSWMEDYRKTLKSIMSGRFRWILLTSLFYDGPVEATIRITDHTKRVNGRPRKTHYNTYSIDHVAAFGRKHGYTLALNQAFDIGIDLPRPQDRGMGTYTVVANSGERLQISGPLLMNWRTLLFMRDPA